MPWMVSRKNVLNVNKLSTYRKFDEMQIKFSKFLLTFRVKSYIIKGVYSKECPKCRNFCCILIFECFLNY